MSNRPATFIQTQIAVLCGAMLLVGMPPFARGDEDLHAQQDTFAAEAAALLPPADPSSFTAAALPPDPATRGEWTAAIPWTPHIPVSAATLPDGRLLTYASNERTTFPSGRPEFTYAATWNPATGQFAEYNNPYHDMFCGALVMLPDGRVLVNGGRNTTVRSSLFDWRVNTWTRISDMNDPRWYNTSVALPNGRVWTVGGSGGVSTAERWDEASGWSYYTGINWNYVTSEPGYITIWHPFLLVAPDGRLIHFGPTDTMHWITPDGSGTMSNTGTTVPGSHYPKEGSWVMYNEGRIVVAGGGVNTTENAGDSTTGTSSTNAFTVDIRSGTPVVTPTTSMRFARQFANCVVLPNGEVMVMGGNTSGLKFDDTGSILTPEIWNPVTGLWRQVADMSVPRNYHSWSLLLPDGRVASGGGGLAGADHQDVQLFTPPTLFNPDGTAATRPILSTVPQSIGVATSFAITGTPGLQKFSFIKMSAITHSVNTDLRFLPLPFTETSPGTYQITAHASLNVMTPGYWMLFGLNAAGAYSVAKIVLVDAIAGVSVAVPGNQSSHLGQPASLQMFASSPAGSVLQWSATGLPNGLSINAASGLISGTPTLLGTFSAHVIATHGSTSDSADFTWTIQPVTLSQNFATFSGASGLTLNGNATISSGVLRLASNVANQAGSAFLTSPVPIGPDTSMTTRWVSRIHGSANGADGMTFIIQGVGASAIGAAGGGLGYGGLGQSVAVEIDNYQGAGDPNANHIAILSNGSVATHLASFTPGWDLEDGQRSTLWVEYNGPLNQLRVYAAQGIVTQRPASPVLTTTIDLPATVGGQAWFGFSGGTGGSFNNHDVETWSLWLNAFALPAPPVLTTPGLQTNVIGVAVNRQLQATDPNGDLLTWSASGLPTGLSISPATGLISGTPTTSGVYSPTVTVTDGNTTPVSAGFTWAINNPLTVQPLSGTAVAVGTTVSLTAQSSGGLNPLYRWSFGDGTPDTSFSSWPSTSHLFSNPGRYLVTVTVRDDTGREVMGSYRQGVYAPPTAAKPAASTSIAYEPRTGSNSRLWVVNPDNDSVTVFDAVTRAKLAEVNVGRAPRSLALAPNGRVWVANADAATLTIVQSNYSIAQTISLPRGSRPFGVVFDPAGLAAYVALENAGKVLKLNPVTGATISSLTVGQHVRHLSATADGARILATRFVTPRLPGEDTANVQTTVGGVDYGGEVLVINLASFTVENTIILKHSEQADTSNSAKGVPNYLGAAAISPDGQSAWVPSKQDNVKRGTLRNGGVLTHDMTVRSIASRIVLASQSEDLAGRIDFDNAGIACAATFDPNGLFLLTALEGSREVVVADAWAKQEILRFEAGRAPQGLVLSPDGRTLFVHNLMDRTVSIHDLNALANGSETPPPAPLLLNCVTTEKLSATVLLGKQFFYDTRDSRVAFQQYLSCAGCHNDGGQDGRVWDFTQFGEGLRNTITLRGHGGTAQGPLHWTGNFDEVQDFEGQIRNFALGQGLMSNTDFHAGTRSQPLGDPKTGLSADLDALAAYVASLTSNGDSPDRNADGTLTAAALVGQAVFQQKNCAQCHSGAKFTDSALNVFHNVGTLKPASGQRLGAPLTGLDTPTLLGLYRTAPYLHDGSAATIEAAVSAHSGVTLNATEMSNLTAFLRQLDDGAISRLPTTITWGNPAAITYGTALSGAQLNATASVPGTFVYNPPSGTMLNAGNGQVLSVTFTPDDLIGYSPTNATVTINVTRAPLTITANNTNKVYGTAPPTFTAKYVGFTNGDTAASLDTPVSLTTTATAASAVGSYPITAAGAADANYTITHVNGSLTVTRAPLTITANNTNKVYGAAPPTFTASYSGFTNGDTAASLDTPVSLTTTATAASAVGSYPITAAGAADANYTITHVNGSLTVTRAPLTITANNTNKVYGAAPPTFTASYSGFANGDTAASLDTPVSLTTTATAASAVGSYPITAAGAADANYTITHVNGSLTVTRALPIITWGNPSAIAPGTALSSAQLNATASVPGTFVYSPPSGTVLNAGSGQVLSTTFTPQDTNNFTNAVKNVLIDVVSPSETAFVVNKVLGTLRNDFSGWLGMQITVGANALTVTQLGRGFVSGNSGGHTVKLVRASDHMDVLNGSVFIAMAGGSAGQFKYAPLSSPVTLGAGTAYYLVSEEFSGGDYWHSIDTALTTTSAGTCDSGVYFGSGYPWSLYGEANQTYVPVDLKYTTGGPTLSTVTITASDAMAAEPGSDTGAFKFTRSGSTNAALTVNYTVSGTATAGADYASIGSTVVIPAGSSNATVTLTPLDDLAAEGSETVIVSLAPNAAYAIGFPDNATVTIVDNEASAETAFVVNKVLGTLRNDYNGWLGMQITVGANALTVTQLGRGFVNGNSGTHTVKLVRASDRVDVPNGSVSIAMAGGSAGQFKYVPLSSPVTLGAGTTYYLVSEEFSGGDYWHSIDTVLTTMSVGTCDSGVYSGGGYPWSLYGGANQTYVPVDLKYTTGGPTLSTVTITASDAMAAEPGSDTGAFKFTRSGSTNAALTVNYTVGGTATAGADYASIGSTVVIPAGSSNATVTLTPLDDLAAEGSETVIVSLTPNAAYAIGSPGNATVTIVDNEASAETAFVVNKVLGTLRNDYNGWLGMQITVGANALTVTQLGRGFVNGNSGTHTVKLVRASDQMDVLNGSVSIAMAGGSAGQFKYAPLSSPVILGAGTTYYLVSEEFSGGDYWHSIDTALTTTSAGTCDSGVYFGSGYPWSLYGEANQTYVPVDLKYTIGGPTLSTVTITASDAIAAEPGSDTGAFKFTRSGSTNAALTVYYTLSGTATAGTDYASIGSTVVIPAGSSNATVTLTPLDDLAAEGSETVIVSLAPNAAYAIGSPDNAAVAIVDNEASAETAFVVNKVLGTLRNDFSGWVGMQITVGANALTVKQLGRAFVSGNSGTHTVKLVRASDQMDVPNGSVSIAMAGGSAGQFKYAPLSSPVTLGAGTTYYLVSEEFNGGDYWHSVDTLLTTMTVGTCDSGVYFGSGYPWSLYGEANQTYVPVDFKY